MMQNACDVQHFLVQEISWEDLRGCKAQTANKANREEFQVTAFRYEQKRATSHKHAKIAVTRTDRRQKTRPKAEPVGTIGRLVVCVGMILFLSSLPCKCSGERVQTKLDPDSSSASENGHAGRLTDTEVVLQETSEVKGVPYQESVEVATPWNDRLYAGVARGQLFAPIGIPTAGYGQAKFEDMPESPFAKNFAATQNQHTPIMAKAIVVRRGKKKLMIVGMDKIGTTAILYNEFVRRLEEETGEGWENSVLLASNHTHSGPGRLWEIMPGEFANDKYWWQYYDKFLDSLVKIAASAAKPGSMFPAEVGYGTTECPECHNDRRCENPPCVDDTMHIFKFVNSETNRLVALVLAFPIHGTVFGWKDFTLSGDAPGMIEHKVEEGFSHPVTVILLQTSAGDVSPAVPDYPKSKLLNLTIPEKYTELEAIGYAAQGHVLQTLGEIETSDVQFDMVTRVIRLTWDVFGYTQDEFPYQNGAIMCGDNQEAPCYGESGTPPDMLKCLPFPPGVNPTYTVMSAFRMGDVVAVTLPGEPHCQLAKELVSTIADFADGAKVVVIGYSQDHLGYIMTPDDWYAGGYEPTVVPWGPKEGQYLVKVAADLAKYLLGVNADFDYESSDIWEPEKIFDLYSPMISSPQAQIVVDVEPIVPLNGEVVVVFDGGDPWLGTPYAYVEINKNGSWNPVVRQNQTKLDSLTYWIGFHLDMIPSWKQDKKLNTREFRWTLHFPLSRNVPSPDVLEPGKAYRLVISGRQVDSQSKVVKYELTTQPFTPYEATE